MEALSVVDLTNREQLNKKNGIERARATERVDFKARLETMFPR